MKNSRFFTILSILIFCALILSCGISKEDLTTQVTRSIEEELFQKNKVLYGLDTKILDLVLVKKTKYEYIGLLTTHEKRSDSTKRSKSGQFDDIICEYDISVVADTDNFKYQLSGKRLKQ